MQASAPRSERLSEALLHCANCTVHNDCARQPAGRSKLFISALTAPALRIDTVSDTSANLAPSWSVTNGSFSRFVLSKPPRVVMIITITIMAMIIINMATVTTKPVDRVVAGALLSLLPAGWQAVGAHSRCIIMMLPVVGAALTAAATRTPGSTASGGSSSAILSLSLSTTCSKPHQLEPASALVLRLGVCCM